MVGVFTDVFIRFFADGACPWALCHYGYRCCHWNVCRYRRLFEFTLAAEPQNAFMGGPRFRFCPAFEIFGSTFSALFYNFGRSLFLGLAAFFGPGVALY